MSLSPIRDHLKRLSGQIAFARMNEMFFTFLRHFLLALALVLLVDISLEVDPYAVRLLMVLAALGWAIYKVVEKRRHPIYAPLNETELARVFERRYPELKGTWVASLEFEGQENNPLVAHFIEDAVKSSDGIEKENMITLGPLRRIRRASFLTVVVLGLSLLIPQVLIAAKRLVNPNQYWPTKNEMTLSVDELVVVKGEPFTITAVTVPGFETPSSAEIFVESDNGETSRFDMAKRVNGEFFVELEDGLQADSEITVEGGDFSSHVPLKIKVVERPRVVELNVTSHYPDYIKLPAVQMPKEQRMFQAIQGSQVFMSMKTNKTIKEAFLKIDGEKDRRPLTVTGDVVTCWAPLLEDGTWRINMKGEHDKQMKPKLALNFEALKDQIPVAKFTNPTRSDSLQMGVLGSINFEGTAEDDFGVKKLEIEMERLTLQDKLIVRRFKLDIDEEGRWAFPVSFTELGAKVGENFKFKLFIEDFKGQQGSMKQRTIDIVSEKDLMLHIDAEMQKIKDLLNKMKKVEQKAIISTKTIQTHLTEKGSYSVAELSSALDNQNSQSSTAEIIMNLGDAIMQMIEGNQIKNDKLIKSLNTVATQLTNFNNKLSPEAVRLLEKLRADKQVADAEAAVVAEQKCLEAIEELLVQLEFGMTIVDIIDNLSEIIAGEEQIRDETKDD